MRGLRGFTRISGCGALGSGCCRPQDPGILEKDLGFRAEVHGPIYAMTCDYGDRVHSEVSLNPEP